ncbi:MAG: complex I NDUFA9 subunit family protein [Rugosibacter sp.]|nr:complex I NDUFA9 subunit family protein [Rugosibacter sp.]
MKKILLIGGSGFLGRALVNELARRCPPAQRVPGHSDGFFLTVPTRHRERAKALIVLPTVDLVQADVHDPATLARLMAGQDAVVNLVGILHDGEGEPYGPGFARAHVELPRKIAVAAKAAGVRRVLHVSALKAAADMPSGYLRSKAAGEAVLQEGGFGLTIFRPSVMFGAGDSFLTLFARLARITPFFPLACASARFQPVWVGDVAATLAQSLLRPESSGQSFDLCGPRQYTLAELVRYAAATAGHPRRIVSLPDTLGGWQARALEWLPKPPMTRDNLRSMRIASVCAEDCALPFGRRATPLEAVAPLYLAPAR